MIVEDQSEVVDFLSSPAAYARGAGDAGAAGADVGPAALSVERIDTHSAAVFLVANRVYKLKRAVHFDYLDYSTLERRRAACLAEVAINRRTAPALYLGVVPVTRGRDGSLELGGEGEPVEWLVEMVRFDEEGLFDRLAERGALDAELMRTLADRIVEFHEAAERRSDQGGREGMAWVIEGNASGLAEHGPPALDPSASARLTEASRAELDRDGELLDRRRREGYVRHCHGDLHLRNICLLDGEPTLFDAMEFNDAIACVDVLYDLAFLLMDLLHRDLTDLANVVLGRYVVARADYEGLRLLPIFLSCRAAIRAKTSVTAAAVQEDEDQVASFHDARSYLAMALELLEPPGPTLVAIGGLSGTGKSTLAARLAPRIGPAPGAVLLRSDEVRKRLFGVALHTDLDPEAYTSEVTREVYRRLREHAEQVVRAGHAAIVDATFLDPRERDAVERVASSAGVPFTGLWLEAAAEVLAGRTEARAASRAEGRTRDVSDADADVLRAQLARDSGPITWNRIDASAPVGAMARSAVEVMDLPVEKERPRGSKETG